MFFLCLDTNLRDKIMIRKNPNGDLPVIHPDAYVDQTAIICGKVIIESGVFIGPYAVIRADEVDETGDMEPIIIGKNTNVQDGVVIHSKSGAAVKIGERSSIAHRSIVHGPCEIGDEVFIGFNAVLYDCKIGDKSVVRHNACVEDCEIPEGFHVPSLTNVLSNEDVQKVPKITPDLSSFSESVVAANRDLVKGYKILSNEF
jgi:carbonic anhydrase/acetyltransferase-like protein (isoleucine patch superfamily)